jgi:tRNA-modifying protein YgfZ
MKRGGADRIISGHRWDGYARGRMSTDWNLIELGDLGVLRFRGADAVRFLQGQVSNDTERLTVERSQLAGYHNPQGRTIAVLRLVQLEPDDVLAILPRELIATVAGRLAKFVLRAKVKIADDSAGWRVAGLVAPHVDGGGAASGVSAAGATRAGRIGAPSVGATGVASAGAASSGVSAAASAGASSSGVSGAAGNRPGGSDELNPDTAAAFEARATSWAAMQFQQASAVAATAGELSSAAAQLEVAESVVPLPTASALMLPDAVHSQSRSGGTVIVRVGALPARWLVISPADEATPISGCVVAGRDAWRLLDIADGESQVYAPTSEEFVAQMLNLDALDAIAFDKGCYTGQEVIARAHYRGRVKRRLQRFVSRGAAKLAVGESGQLADGRAFKVVEAVQLGDGRSEFLAVAPLVAGVAVEGGSSGQGAGAGTSTAAGAGGQGAETNTSVAAGAGGQGAGAGARVTAGAVPEAIAEPTRSAAVIDAEVLPLPYPLPE